VTSKSRIDHFSFPFLLALSVSEVSIGKLFFVIHAVSRLRSSTICIGPTDPIAWSIPILLSVSKDGQDDKSSKVPV